MSANGSTGAAESLLSNNNCGRSASSSCVRGRSGGSELLSAAVAVDDASILAAPCECGCELYAAFHRYRHEPCSSQSFSVGVSTFSPSCTTMFSTGT